MKGRRGSNNKVSLIWVLCSLMGVRVRVCCQVRCIMELEFSQNPCCGLNWLICRQCRSMGIMPNSNIMLLNKGVSKGMVSGARVFRCLGQVIRAKGMSS